MTGAAIRAIACRALAATIALAALLGAGPARAVDEDFRAWEAFTIIAKLGSISPGLEKWRLWVDGQVRQRDDARTLDQAPVRAGVGYALSDHASVWLGYMYMATLPKGRPTQNEHRIWQQLMLTDTTPFGDLMGRTRLEQRYIQGVEPVEWRFRQMVRWSRPFYEGSPFSTVVWDEVFVRMNSTTPSTRFGFDQNRVFAGFGYAFSKEGRIEVGYLNQFIQSRVVTRRSQSFGERMNHILMINLFLNL